MLGTAMMPLKVSKAFWMASVCFKKAASETRSVRGTVAEELIVKRWGLQKNLQSQMSLKGLR